MKKGKRQKVGYAHAHNICFCDNLIQEYAFKDSKSNQKKCGKERLMSNIINTKKISAARRLADRFDFSEPKPEPETPKEWNDLPLLLNTKILSGMLHISMPTITKLVTSGELKACKIAGKWFIEKDDFKEFLRKKTASSTEVIT